MRATLEGSLDQIIASLALPKRRARRQKPRAKNGDSTIAKANRVAAEQHAILRQALEIVRRDPLEKSTYETILAALVGRKPRNRAVMDTARKIIANHHQQENESERAQEDHAEPVPSSDGAVHDGEEAPARG